MEGDNMNWQHLQYFKTVAEAGNYAKASEQLFITTSALSKAISSLEQELNFPLFEKSGRNSVLTPYGKTFKSYVDKALDTIDMGIADVQSQLDLYTGTINIMGTYIMCADFLPPRIRSFMEIYPQVRFSMVYNITAVTLDSVMNGTQDLGFCGEFDSDDPRYKNIGFSNISSDDLVIITPKEHPLSKDYYIDFRKLDGENFITYRSNDTGVHRLYVQLCEKYGVKPKIAFEVPDDQSIIGLVAAGLGCALIADNSSLRSENVHVLHFREDEVPKSRSYIIWRKDRYIAPVVSAFRDFILDEIPDSVSHR